MFKLDLNKDLSILCYANCYDISMQSLTKTIVAALSHNIFYEICIFSILCKFLVQIYDLHFLQIITCAMYTKINKICNI